MASGGLTPQALSFAMTTLQLSSDELLELLKRAKDYKGEDDYPLWLCHQIIVMAEKEDNIPFSQFPLKWASFRSEIEDGFDTTSRVSDSLRARLETSLADVVISMGGLEDLESRASGETVDWFAHLDLNHHTADFVDVNIPTDLQSIIFDDEKFTVVAELRHVRTKKTALSGSLKSAGLAPNATQGEQLLYRLCNLVQVHDLTNLQVILQTSTSFWSETSEAARREFFSHFKPKEVAFIEHPVNLFAGASTAQNQMLSTWVPAEGNPDLAVEAKQKTGEVQLFSPDHKTRMIDFLESTVTDSPTLGYLVFSTKFQTFVLSNKGSEKALPINKDNLDLVLATVGLSQAQKEGVTLSGDIFRVQDGLDGFRKVVADSIPLALYGPGSRLTLDSPLIAHLESTMDLNWGNMQVESKTFMDFMRDLTKKADEGDLPVRSLVTEEKQKRYNELFTSALDNVLKKGKQDGSFASFAR